MSSAPFDAKITAEKIKKPFQELFMDTMNLDLSNIENVSTNEILMIVYNFRQQMTPANLEVISAAKAIMEDAFNNRKLGSDSDISNEISPQCFWFLLEIFQLVK